MTRTKRSWLAAVLAGAFVIGVAVTSEAAPTPPIVGDVPIQPGAPVLDNMGINSPAFGWIPFSSRRTYCTLNFVFKDTARKSAKTYIGASSNCLGFGRASAPGIGEFGTVVYTDWRVGFSLIQIDAKKLKYVSRTVRGYGAAPSGYATSNKMKAGDLLITHGYPVAGGGPSGVTRTGVLVSSSSDGYFAATTPILDRGSPVVRVLDGKAVGVSTELDWPLAQPSMEGVFSSLRHAGFKVTL